MKILENGKKIYWPFVFFLIMYYQVDGTISFILSFGYVCYFLIIKQHGKILKLGIMIPILLMLIQGILLGVTNLGNDYFRDIYYFFQPIIYIFGGYYIEENKGQKYDLEASIVIASFLLGCVFLIGVAHNPAVLFQSDNIREIRNEVGKETFIALVGVTLLTIRNIKFNRKYKVILSAVLISVFVLQFSRASIGTIAIFYICYFILDNKKTNIKSLKRIGLLIATIIIIITVMPDSLLSDFVQRILRSSTEISSNVSGTWTANEAYANWRGYEIYLVTEAFLNGTIIQKLFGYGFGNRVALGRGIVLNSTFTSIPVFHNGYIQVLNKVGLCGIFLLISFYILIVRFCLRIGRIGDTDNKEFSRYVCALFIGVWFYSYFKGGIFRGTSIIEIMIFIGFLIYRVKNRGFRL